MFNLTVCFVKQLSRKELLEVSYIKFGTMVLIDHAHITTMMMYTRRCWCDNSKETFS